mgnify:FL=1
MRREPLLLWAAVVAGLALLCLVAFCALFPPEIDAQTLAHFERDQVERAQDYAQVRYLLFAGGQALVILLLSAAVLVLFRQGWLPFPGANPYLQVAAFVLLLLVAIELVTLPLDYYRGFVLEHRFGLSTQTTGQWLGDQVLGFLVRTVLTLVVFTGLFLIIRAVPAYWPVVASAAFGLFLVVQSVISPVIIDPLFHKFHPLPEGPFRERVVSMADQAGIEVGEVLVADASRRTTRANAYVTGLGNTKRIVFYDNLLNRFSQREAELVLAHEIGHWRHRHIIKGIVMGVGGALVFFLLYRLILGGYGVPAGHPATVPVLLLFVTVFSLLAMPAQNAVFRSFERQADRVSLELTGDAAGAVQLYQNLARTNLADVQPHPFIRTVLFTHPPAVERISAAEQWVVKR